MKKSTVGLSIVLPGLLGLTMQVQAAEIEIQGTLENTGVACGATILESETIPYQELTPQEKRANSFITSLKRSARVRISFSHTPSVEFELKSKEPASHPGRFTKALYSKRTVQDVVEEIVAEMDDELGMPANARYVRKVNGRTLMDKICHFHYQMPAQAELIYLQEAQDDEWDPSSPGDQYSPRGGWGESH